MRLRAFDVAALLLAAAVGLAAGIGFFTFVYAHGAAYMTNDPAACANCHVMGEEYGAWMKGPHHTVAVCNDCHTPHNVLAKYAIKARNGFWHSYYFTRGKFPEPIRITGLNRRVTEGACRHCHGALVHGLTARDENGDGEGGELSCIHCHASVGHANRD
jgi:cytochrome c nitrite reductase small subunit